MGNHIRVLTAIILSELLIEWPAYLLGISMAKIISLVIFSTISAAIFHFIFFFKNKETHSLTKCMYRFGYYLKRTFLFSLLLIVLLIMNILKQSDTTLIFFEWFVLVMFYTIGFILCSNNIQLKGLKED